jgi:hypothetical protein
MSFILFIRSFYTLQTDHKHTPLFCFGGTCTQGTFYFLILIPNLSLFLKELPALLTLLTHPMSLSQTPRVWRK